MLARAARRAGDGSPGLALWTTFRAMTPSGDTSSPARPHVGRTGRATPGHGLPEPSPHADGTATARRGRLPSLFIAGQPKSGTTALYEMLREHPQIFMPDRKEPRFFCGELLHRDPPRPGGTPKTLEEYMTWFEDARPDQIVGEASPWYLWSPTAAARIAAVVPDARIVVSLREPASLVRSLHMEWVQLYVETETDLRRAVSLEADRRAGRNVPKRTYWPQLLQYAEHAKYVEQLGHLEAEFPHEQLLVLIYDDFRRDNEGTLDRVLRFIGVDPGVPLPVKDANPSVRVRSARMHELIHALSVGHGPVSHGAKAALKAVTPRALRRRALFATQKRLVWAPPLPPDEPFMAELRSRFKPDVVALSEHLGRDLVALWGYDRVD